MKNCVEVILPLREAIGGRDDIQLIGGIGTAALTHPKTAIVAGERRIVAPADLNVPQFRENGTLRDLDVLVLSTKRERIEEVEDTVRGIVGDELELSIFGLKPAVKLSAMKYDPLRAARSQFVSDRYAFETSENGIIYARKALFPFEVSIHPETLETWQLYIGKKDKYPTPIPNPGASVLNYLTRSVSGLRPRDVKKVHEAAQNIAAQAPEMTDWLMDGPGQSQVELARILQQLSRWGSLALGNLVTVTPTKGKLRQHPAFMIPDEKILTQEAVLALTYAKARIIHWYESVPLFVKLWQKMGEKRVQKIIHNE